MLLQTLKRVAVLACAVLALANLPAAADDKKDDKDKPNLSGAWAQKGGELKISFSDKDVMRIYPHGENEVIIIVCNYTVEKRGLVKAKICELEGKGKDMAKEQLPVGLEFSFKWQVQDATATLDDLKGKNVDILKAHLEGKYDQKK